MTPVKDALQLFKEKFLLILLTILLFVVPIQLLYTLVVNYATLPFQLFHIPLWSTMIQAFFMFVVLFIIQLPFISMALQYARNEDVRLGQTVIDALKHMFPVYVLSLFIALLIVTGSLLFVIPGFVLLILFFGISYTAVIDDQTWFSGIKQSWAFGKAYFFKLSGLLFVFGIIDVLISLPVLFIVYLFTGLYIVFNLALIITNGLVFSVLFFIVTFYYLDWPGAGGVEVR